MVELFGIWFVAMFISYIVFAVLRNFWIRVKWYAFGIKPFILDEGLMSYTVQRCAKLMIEQQEAQYGVFEGKQRAQLTSEMESFVRYCIEDYILRYQVPPRTKLDGVGANGRFGGEGCQLQPEELAGA